MTEEPLESERPDMEGPDVSIGVEQENSVSVEQGKNIDGIDLNGVTGLPELEAAAGEESDAETTEQSVEPDRR